jgi:hypothetical protein
VIRKATDPANIIRLQTLKMALKFLFSGYLLHRLLARIVLVQVFIEYPPTEANFIFSNLTSMDVSA